MKDLQFSYLHAGVSTERMQELHKELETEIKRIAHVVKTGGYEEAHASVNALDDQDTLRKCKELAHACKDAEAIVVIGIGGSNLGTLAIHEAIQGKLYNALNKPRVFFADTVDSRAMADITTLVEAYAKAGKRVILNVISKSGGTTETIANFEVLLKAYGKHKEHVEQDIVAITEKGSSLWKLSQMRNYHILEMPSNVGGRYSVFTAVGLFPLAVLGIDVQSLLEGARHMRERCTQLDTENNPASRSAIIRYEQFMNNRTIQDLFLFGTYLESIGKWYRQLFAESLGKEWNKAHTKQVWTGITPTASIGSTDLHSVGQLYLGGPADKFTVFVEAKREVSMKVPEYPEFEGIVPHIQNKTLHDILTAILQGTHKAFEAHNRPFIIVTLPEISAYALGQFLQMQMIEVMYLAYLMDVNPFDQPNVESYKKETKKILSTSE